ncbi:DUF397 domain-containing protein [Streptomyces sp. NPDC048717]|uniref:DUF397 domain-containing protein n=1 Tax=Streptomyces sp. NPDC048717 TaxID=3154928 RepID=UPI003433E2E3
MKRVENAEWFKSSHSNGNGECVEVAHLDGTVAMRDSKVEAGPVVTCALDGWRAFIDGVAHDGL